MLTRITNARFMVHVVGSKLARCAFSWMLCDSCLRCLTFFHRLVCSLQVPVVVPLRAMSSSVKCAGKVSFSVSLWSSSFEQSHFIVMWPDVGRLYLVTFASNSINFHFRRPVSDVVALWAVAIDGCPLSAVACCTTHSKLRKE